MGNTGLYRDYIRVRKASGSGITVREINNMKQAFASTCSGVRRLHKDIQLIWEDMKHS